MRKITGFAAIIVTTLLIGGGAARADFVFTDLTRASLSAFDSARWSSKQESDRITLVCEDCPAISAVDIQIGADDGTGERVRSGQTTAATMTEIGRRNAARNPGASEYFGAEAIRRGTAVGFRQEARALRQFTVTYILWDGGHRLIIRGFAPDRDVARRIAQEGYDKIAAQMAR
jgi:hypothetical protein